MKRSKRVRYLCQAAFAVAAGLTLGMPVQGQDIPGSSDDVRYGFNPREVALLPRYCIHTQAFRDNVQGGNSPDEINRLTLLMGPTFHAMHHYCWGLMYTNRAFLVRDQQTRGHYLRASIGEFDYVIRRASPDFKLLPEILTKKGENLIRLDRSAQGIMELERAIELKPDYWPAYAAMSDYYKNAGDRAKARQWLESGLSYAPEVNALKRRLAEIDRRQSPAH